MSDAIARSEDQRLDEILLLLRAVFGHLAGLPKFPDELRPVDLTIELNRFVRLPEVARLRGVSVDTIELNESEKLVDLSPRCKGMRLRDALLLTP